jgi:hypothetical protein
MPEQGQNGRAVILLNPNIIEALKKTRPLGQVKLLACLVLQIFVIFPNAHSITASWTTQDHRVPMICAKNMTCSGIFR